MFTHSLRTISLLLFTILVFSVANSWATQGEDSSFVSSANNQFSLQPGTYFIEAELIGIVTHDQLAALTEAGSDSIIISRSYAQSETNNITNIKGVVNISAPQTFQLNHQKLNIHRLGRY